MFELGEPSSASLVATVYEYAESSVADVTAVLSIVGASGWSDSTDTCEATAFVFPAASLATPAATLIVIVASEAGVIVAVYDEPLPDSEADPLLSVMSLAANPVTVSLNVIVTANVEPVAGEDPLYAIVVVGAVVSTVNDVSDSALAVLPAESVKVTVQTYALSPLVERVKVFDPDAMVDVELSPHPVVPPTAMVPTSPTLITTSGVVSVVGVLAAVASLGAATV